MLGLPLVRTSRIPRLRLWPALTAVVIAIALTVGSRSVAPTPVHAAAHTVSWDRYSPMIDGKRVYVRSADVHYWRLPSPDLWLDILEKLKADGFNTVQVYFDWAYHSPKQGVYDFTGVRDIERFLKLTEQVGLYVIARPGPYINAETDSGGFPGWTETEKGMARTSAPDYTAAYMEWLSAIDPILARHQITRGGSIILYQVENEYSIAVLDPTYMEAIEAKAKADGIDVPTDHNDVSPAEGVWAQGPGAVDIYAFDSYPLLFDCSHPTNWSGSALYEEPEGFELGTRKADPTDPVSIAEFQAGSFDPWGGPGYPACYNLTGVDFLKVYDKSAVAQGATIFNNYMGYGGTSWGWLPYPGVYTSYDYGVGVNEARQLTTKYDEAKRLNYMLQAATPLLQSDPVPSFVASNPRLAYRERVNTSTGTQFYTIRQTPIDSTSDQSTTITITGTASLPVVIPQKAGTAIRLQGRDAKIVIAGMDLGAQRLVYSTSELMTDATIGGRDVALFYGRPGEDGETTLNFGGTPPVLPTVTVLAGAIDPPTYNALTGDLRLNYVHSGLIRVRVQAGQKALLLLIGTDDEAAKFWRNETPSGVVLTRGPYLVRTAAITGAVLALRGDTTGSTPTPLEVFAPAGVTSVTWNGLPVATTSTTSGSLLGTLNGPPAVSLPALTNWRFHRESPETQPAFDDSGWVKADHTTTNNPTAPTTLPVLYVDDYGYHYGDVWFRGHFSAMGTETSVTLDGRGGANSVYAVWLNGVYLGSASGAPPATGSSNAATFTFPAGSLRPHSDNVVSLLLENMGHDEDGSGNDGHKAVRGFMQATLNGSSMPLSWRIQGALGGENVADPMRGPFNNGGLYGERNGWSLPGFDDSTWSTVTLPDAWAADGVPAGVGWYRATFDLSLPASTDVPIGLRITDAKTRAYRSLIFLNGWLIGRYINNLGPQTVFYLPAGILNTNGHNTLAISSWGLDNTSGGLGKIDLIAYGSYASPLTVGLVNSPGFTPAPSSSPTVAPSATPSPSTMAVSTSSPTAVSISSPTVAPPSSPTAVFVPSPTAVSALPSATSEQPTPTATPVSILLPATATTRPAAPPLVATASSAVATLSPTGVPLLPAASPTLTFATPVAVPTFVLATPVAPAPVPPAVSRATTFYIPGLGESSATHSALQIVNPGGAPLHATATFYDARGHTSKRSLLVAAHAEAAFQVSRLTSLRGALAAMVSTTGPAGVQGLLLRPGRDGDVVPATTKPGVHWYFAEGYTGLTFRETIAVLNPDPIKSARVTLRLLPLNGKAVRTDVLRVAPHAQALVDVGALLHGGHSVSVIVESTRAVAVERTLTFSYAGKVRGYGLTAQAGVAAPATRWYFAEGTTSNHFETYLTVLNPGASIAHVEARFYGPDGRLLGKHMLTVGPARRANILVNSIVKATGIASVVTSDKKVVVEQPEYFGSPNAARVAGSVAPGRTNVVAVWSFPGGGGRGMSEFLLLYNPSTRALPVDVVLYGADGAVIRYRLSIPARARLTANVEMLAPRFMSTHGLVVRSLNGQGFVAEQTTFAHGRTTLATTQGLPTGGF